MLNLSLAVGIRLFLKFRVTYANAKMTHDSPRANREYAIFSGIINGRGLAHNPAARNMTSERAPRPETKSLPHLNKAFVGQALSLLLDSPFIDDNERLYLMLAFPGLAARLSAKQRFAYLRVLVRIST
jgi:hypothetical protein